MSKKMCEANNCENFEKVRINDSESCVEDCKCHNYFSDKHIYTLKDEISVVNYFISRIYFKDQRKDWHYPDSEQIFQLYNRIKKLKNSLTEFEKAFEEYYEK